MVKYLFVIMLQRYEKVLVYPNFQHSFFSFSAKKNTNLCKIFYRFFGVELIFVYLCRSLTLKLLKLIS
ncbi:hypothetical protein SAMN06298211_10139 [Prevotellaceae bacterium MN60]|nr:hypothetical protein SAMN06298211_10139 [Prevotellaceae bacterium MN60]